MHSGDLFLVRHATGSKQHILSSCSSLLTTVEKVMMLQYMEYTHLQQQQHAWLQCQLAHLRSVHWISCEYNLTLCASTATGMHSA
jgi:hypothetical protein